MGSKDDDRKQIEKETKQVRQRIKSIADKVTYDIDGKHIDYEITNEWTTIAKAVSAIQCVLNSSECTVLNMIISNGGYIPKHKHTRQEEIFVVSGEITDGINNVTTSAGRVYIIPPNTPHEIRSDYAKLTVVYRPPFPRIQVDAKVS